MPPAVGWLFTYAFRSRVRSRTSTTDQSHGGRYSPRRNRRATNLRHRTLTGVKEPVFPDRSAIGPHRAAPLIAPLSVNDPGFVPQAAVSGPPAPRAVRAGP